MGELSTRAPARLYSLDALRGLLACSVMCFHLTRWLFDVDLPALGTYSVYSFFVLSGLARTVH